MIEAIFFLRLLFILTLIHGFYFVYKDRVQINDIGGFFISFVAGCACALGIAIIFLTFIGGGYCLFILN